MSVLDFPHGALGVDPEGDYPTVGLPFIVRELGKRGYSLARQIAYAQLLVDECAFPPPYPSMVGKKGAEQLTHAVTRDSSWPRRPVEIWLEDFLPPGNADQVDARAQREAADEMDQAAGNLRLVVGGRGE